MSTVTIATDAADAAAIESVEEHHSELAAALARRVRSLVAAVNAHDGRAISEARRELTTWAAIELVPHAEAEEHTLYPAAHDTVEGRLLVSAMLDEHATLAGLVEQVASRDAVASAGAATALETLFTSHVRKENLLLLPLLAARPDVSLAELLHEMHRALATADPVAVPTEAEPEANACGCHEADDTVPELDARTIPHAIRHPMIFAALDEVAPGDAIVIVAPHDPLPLLGQIEERSPNAFAVEYLQRGPGAWRLRFTREPR